MNVIDTLRSRWRECGVLINEGCDVLEIDRFEKEKNIRLTSDFKTYLSTVNGMQPGQTDEYLIAFLSLATIEKETIHRTPEEIDVPFAEYSVYSHYYVLRVRDRDECAGIFACDGQNEVSLAATFERFLIKYLSDPAKVAYPW